MLVSLRCGRTTACFLSIFLGTTAVIPSASAQTLLRGPGAAALDPQFRAVLEQPSNVEVNLAFARRAIELEDFEAAVATLERLLIGREGLPLIRLELGMLYLRLQAPELAEAYFLQVLDDQTIGRTVRERATVLLESTRKANSRNSFAAFVNIGVKHQSNAVTKPEIEDVIAQNSIRQSIQPQWPDLREIDYPNLTPESDVNYNGSISLSYSRELDGLTERRFNASINHFASSQASEDLEALDISVTSLRLGFDLPLARGSAKAPLSFNPYFSGSVLNTDVADGYAVTVAAGLSLNGYLLRRNPLAFSIEAGEKTHGEDRDESKDGARYNSSLSLGHIHNAGGYSSFSVKYDRAHADDLYEASTGLGATLSHSRPLFGFSLGISLSYRENERDGIQSNSFAPVLDDVIREDKDTNASISLGRSFYGVNTSFSVSYARRQSNIPDAQYEDVTGGVSFSRSFQ